MMTVTMILSDPNLPSDPHFHVCVLLYISGTDVKFCTQVGYMKRNGAMDVVRVT